MKKLMRVVLTLSLGYGFLFAQAIDFEKMYNENQEMMDKYQLSDSCKDAFGQDTLYTWKAGLENDNELIIKYLDVVINSKVIMIKECPEQYLIDFGRDLNKELQLIQEAKDHYKNR